MKIFLDAAIEEFREQGFLGAKTTTTAKNANVSSRSFYNHLESQEVLFEARPEIMIERNWRMEPVPNDPDRDFVEQLKVTLWRCVRVITEETAIGLNRMAISELIRDLDRSRQIHLDSETHDYPVTRQIGDAMEAGVIRRTDPAFATSQLLVLISVFLGESPTPKSAMDDCIALFLTLYKPDR